MKKALLTATLTIAALVFSPAARAQFAADPGAEALWPLLPGGTTTLAANSANVYNLGSNPITVGSPGTTNALEFSVEEFNDVGFSWSYNGLSSTSGGAVTCSVFRSYDGGKTFEQNPGWIFSSTPNGVGNYATNADLYVPGVSHLGFLFTNASGGVATNALLEIYVKLPKRGIVVKSR